MLSGNVFCGHCGGRITVSSSSCFYETKEGVKQRYVNKNYVCGNRANRRCDCDGQAGYKIEIVDTAIENMVTNILSNIADTPQSVAIAKTYEARISELKDFSGSNRFRLTGKYVQLLNVVKVIKSWSTDNMQF